MLRLDPYVRLLYAFDGTNNDKDRDTAKGKSTNVAILWSLYQPEGAEGAFYMNGLGTRDGVVNLPGSIAGLGFGRRVANMFEQFEKQYKMGDCKVDILGFSRGAAEARDFANRVNAKRPNLRIRWLGLFDTVESVGLPATDEAGYRMNVPDSVERAIQLVAADEHRRWFPLTSIKPSATAPLDPRYAEIYMPGAHSDIGGGYDDNRSLANRALKTMWQDGVNHGVPFGPIPDQYRNYDQGDAHDSRYWFYDKPLDLFSGRWDWFRGPRPRIVIFPLP